MCAGFAGMSVWFGECMPQSVLFAIVCHVFNICFAICLLFVWVQLPRVVKCFSAMQSWFQTESLLVVLHGSRCLPLS